VILKNYTGRKQKEAGTREHRLNTEKGILRRVSVSILKISD
jgi:hypothetical protein